MRVCFVLVAVQLRMCTARSHMRAHVHSLPRSLSSKKLGHCKPSGAVGLAGASDSTYAEMIKQRDEKLLWWFPIPFYDTLLSQHMTRPWRKIWLATQCDDDASVAATTVYFILSRNLLIGSMRVTSDHKDSSLKVGA